MFTLNGLCFFFHLFIRRFQSQPVSADNNLVDLHCIHSTSHSAYIIDIQYIFLQWILVANFVIIIFQKLFQVLCSKPFFFFFQFIIYCCALIDYWYFSWWSFLYCVWHFDRFFIYSVNIYWIPSLSQADTHKQNDIFIKNYDNLSYLKLATCVCTEW